MLFTVLVVLCWQWRVCMCVTHRQTERERIYIYAVELICTEVYFDDIKVNNVVDNNSFSSLCLHTHQSFDWLTDLLNYVIVEWIFLLPWKWSVLFHTFGYCRKKLFLPSSFLPENCVLCSVLHTSIFYLPVFLCDVLKHFYLVGYWIMNSGWGRGGEIVCISVFPIGNTMFLYHDLS